jgi:hypothetical protein
MKFASTKLKAQLRKDMNVTSYELIGLITDVIKNTSNLKKIFGVAVAFVLLHQTCQYTNMLLLLPRIPISSYCFYS